MNATGTLVSDPLMTTTIEKRTDVKKDPFGWFYSLVQTGVYLGVVIHGKEVNNDVSITLHFPDYIDDKPVVGIAKRAFAYCNNLEAISHWPCLLQFIDTQAFIGCDRLSSYLSLPCDLKYIHSEAFADCIQLKIAELPFYLKQIAIDSFRGCVQLKYLIYPSMHSVQIVKAASTINRPFEFPLYVGHKTILLVPYDIYSEVNRLCNEFYFYEIRAMNGR